MLNAIFSKITVKLTCLTLYSAARDPLNLLKVVLVLSLVTRVTGLPRFWDG
jgi:hypothetical protein